MHLEKIFQTFQRSQGGGQNQQRAVDLERFSAFGSKGVEVFLGSDREIAVQYLQRTGAGIEGILTGGVVARDEKDATDGYYGGSEHSSIRDNSHGWNIPRKDCAIKRRMHLIRCGARVTEELLNGVESLYLSAISDRIPNSHAGGGVRPRTFVQIQPFGDEFVDGDGAALMHNGINATLK